MEDNGTVIGTKGELLGVIYRIEKGEMLRIGRDSAQCQIVLKKPDVSRIHCIVRHTQNENYEVEDCSKNGVYVEGIMIGQGNKLQAHAGNRICLCDETLELRLG